MTNGLPPPVFEKSTTKVTQDTDENPNISGMREFKMVVYGAYKYEECLCYELLIREVFLKYMELT